MVYSWGIVAQMSLSLKKFFKDYRESFVHLIGTILLFSNSFSSHDNAILVTLAFLLIVNLTCFSNEYFVLKYYKKNPNKDSNKGYDLFIMAQFMLSLLIFVICNVLV